MDLTFTRGIVGRVVNVGVALLVYARDDNGVAPRVRDVQTQWTSTGPLCMGNKGAVAIRFNVGLEHQAGHEVFTSVPSTSNTLLRTH